MITFKIKEFYGVPLEGDVGREAYQLVCADSQGLMAIDGIEVHVVGRPFDERYKKNDRRMIHEECRWIDRKIYRLID